jgi:flagellar hook-length control protein FliK
MINLTPNSFTPAPQALPSAPAQAAGDAPRDLALPFAELLGQLAEAVAAGPEVQPAADDGADGPTDTAADDAGPGAEQPAAPCTPPVLLAMAMPMPGAAVALAAGVDPAPAAAASGARPDLPVDAAARPAHRADPAPFKTSAASPPPPLDQQAGAAAPALAPLPASVAGPASAATPAAAVVRAAAPAAASAGAPDGFADAGIKLDSVGGVRDGIAGAFTAPASAAPQGAADRVPLAGPPSAWRQGLHEALGERLNLQLGSRVEQAVIRLDPPQLGRIEIAIRHSEGSLQVTLSASHGEVLRQLQAVSDNLRNDLAQRQYTEVAVTVTPAPRSGAANPFGGDAQNRGRQPGREHEDQAPGLALHDAGAQASPFSMTGRE